MIEGLDHVAVLVRDIDAALPHYRDRLGMAVISDETVETGVRVAFLDTGTTRLQLMQPTKPGAFADQLAERGEGLHHLCFAVGKIEDALARLAPDDQVDVFIGAEGRRACFLPPQPNGVRVELTEIEPDATRSARIGGA